MTTTDSGRLSVVLVDDDALVRTGLALILGGAPDLEVVAEASDGVEAIAVVRRHRPDLVLMDIRMPRRDGIEATILLRGEPNPPKVVVLTTFDTDSLVLSALRAGADGFLLKDTPPAAMIEAIRSVAAGEPVLSPTVTRQLIESATAGDGDTRRAAALADLARLTEREREVATAIGRGLSNAEIGRELYMSVATVKAHVSHVLDKFGADNRVQIAIRVHDAGLT